MTKEILNRIAIAEGCVLLKNKDSVLPLKGDDEISIFGRCQLDFYKSGTGSGGSVHVPYSRNLIDGFDRLRAEGEVIPHINQKLLNTYREWIKANPFDNGNGEWAGEPWFQKEMTFDKKFLSANCKKTQKAIYVLGRTAGEDMDNKAEKGSWFLTDDEKKCLEEICTFFSQVIVVLNVPNILDLSWLLEKPFANKIKGLLFCWHGGMDGGSGLADPLCGKRYPSGKLTDTIALSIDDYPSAKNFGSAENEFYKEDIFVGYRYFYTFAKEKILFPFGFGLGYTSFSLEAESISYSDFLFCVKVSVTNTGNEKGKEVVQVYAECPQGKIGKSKRILCGYKKTPELSPGESCRIEISFSEYSISSYDDSGLSGFANAYVLEKGSYHFLFGNSSKNLSEIFFDEKKTFKLTSTKVIKECSQSCAPRIPFERLCTVEENKKVPLNKSSLVEKINQNIPKEIKFIGNRNLLFEDIKRDPKLINAFIAQLTDEELITLVRGEGMMSRKVTAGIASAFGGTSDALHDKYHIPVAGCADGPSGIRLDTGEEASLIPTGTLLASTWNDTLVEDLYAVVGQELYEKNIDLLLGPGCNIHRNPLNGRNFEYYSEDPLLSGKIAAAAVRGLSMSGAIGTIKHFACNNQESHRRTENSIVSERALREIYLKPFEIAVKEGNASAVMTSYNGLNGMWCASNYDLTQSILRGEWNFTGIVMTDWWAGMTDCVNGNKESAPSTQNLSAMVRARTNLYMVVPNDSADKNGLGDNLSSDLAEEKLSRAEIQRSAKDILLFLMKTKAANNPLKPLRNEMEIPAEEKNISSGGKIFTGEGSVSFSENKYAWIKIEEEGVYNISGTFVKEADDLSQSVTNILFNGKVAGSFSCRSTQGKPMSATVGQPHLFKGFYKVEVKETKAGINLLEVSIRSDKRLPANTEKDLGLNTNK